MSCGSSLRRLDCYQRKNLLPRACLFFFFPVNLAVQIFRHCNSAAIYSHIIEFFCWINGLFIIKDWFSTSLFAAIFIFFIKKFCMAIRNTVVCAYFGIKIIVLGWERKSLRFSGYFNFPWPSRSNNSNFAPPNFRGDSLCFVSCNI